MLKMKIIQPSKSQWGAPCILVRKPLENGLPQPLHFVVDYKGLNSVTRGDGYPIPSVASVLDSISLGKVFGHCDLASGLADSSQPTRSPQKCLSYSRATL